VSDRPQSNESHAMLVTGYHKVGFTLLLVLLINSIVSMVRDFSVAAVMSFVLAIALLIISFYARVFALGVQDRVIRLEERMRMERVLPDDLKARMMDVTTNQLIGLRFAPDEELAGLVGQVLDGSLTTRKEIKAAIKNWKADNQRI
jgi:hypothetical protein